MNLILEDAEARMLKGEAVDQDKYLSLANCHRRAIEALGVLNSEPIPKTEESAKPLAAAILGIIQDGGADVAKIIGLNSDESGSQPAPALTLEEESPASLTDSGSSSFFSPPENPDTPNFSPPPETEGPEKFPNGASVEAVEINGSRQSKFAVFDHRGHLHGYRRSQRDAIALAENLPTPSFTPASEEDEVHE